LAISLPPNVSIATLQGFLRDRVINPNMRKSAFLERLKAKKCVEYNKRGITACTWPAKHGRRDIEEIDGTQTPISLPYYSLEDQASLSWSQYRMGDSIPKIVRLMNAAGPTQVFSLYEKHLTELTDDFLQAYRYRLWQDGNRTRAGLAGILTAFGSSATPSYFSSQDRPVYNQPKTDYVSLDDSAATGARTDGNSWWACSPTQTYAGISTVLGTRDSTWNGPSTVGWPDGSFSPGFCYWSPIICNYQSSYFTPNAQVTLGVTTYTWKSQWQQAVNRTCAFLNDIRNAGVDTIMMTSTMLADCEDSMISQQRFVAGEMGADAGDVSLGIRNLSYNGRQFITEFGVPANCAFCLPFSKLHLWSMQGDIIANEKDMDIVTLEDLFALDAFTQLWIESPAFLGLLVPGVYGS
jgi:hypothetical protein